MEAAQAWRKPGARMYRGAENDGGDEGVDPDMAGHGELRGAD